MKALCQLFGVLLILGSLYLLIDSQGLFEWFDKNQNSLWLYLFAILFRLLFGVLFIVTCKQSKYPTAIKILGYFLVFAGLVLALMGHNAFKGLLAHILPTMMPFAYVSALLGLGLGGFIVHAFLNTNHK